MKKNLLYLGIFLGLIFGIIKVFPSALAVSLLWGSYQLDTQLPVLILFLVVFLSIGHVFLNILFSRRRKYFKNLSELFHQAWMEVEGEAFFLADKKINKGLKNSESFWIFLEYYKILQHSSKKEALKSLEKFPSFHFLIEKEKIDHYLKKEDQEEALKLLTLLEEKGISFPWVYRKLFYIYLEQEEFQKAEVLLKKIKTSQKNYYKYQSLFLFYQSQFRSDDALYQEASLRKAYKIDPSSVSIAQALSKFLFEQQKKGAAEEILHQTWKVAPCLEIAQACIDLQQAEVPSERFKKIHLFFRGSQHYAAHWALAKTALEAELWIPAREHLMLLKEHEPLLAYPLLANLEERQYQDLPSAFKWLKKGYEENAFEQDTLNKNSACKS